ncbi:MAG: hypothetical protein ACC642_06695, partial [Pseudomonadales bacterium]
MKRLAARGSVCCVLLGLTVIAGCGDSTPEIRAERIFVGDHILTLDDAYPQASAVAIGEGKILWVGSRAIGLLRHDRYRPGRAGFAARLRR